MPQSGSHDEAHPFWSESAEAQFGALTTGATGLSKAEAARRLTVHGRNAIADHAPQRVLRKILKRLIDPLVAILLVAAAVSGATGDLASCAIIVSIVAVSIALEVTQEHRAENAVEALKRTVSVHATVRRDGRTIEVPIAEIVPGDVVELSAGDLVPADGVVLEAAGAQANESLLTGESYPVDKRPGACAAAAPAEAFNALFSGTVLVRGTAAMLAVATGGRTRFGAIAAGLEQATPPASLERGLHAFAVLIMRLTGFLVLFVLLAHLASSRPVIDSFLFAIALAVGMTPELLPMIMTVTLSRGAVRMAARKVVVKRLAAIHDLGAMSVLCTDKTGTLTQAKIMLAAHTGIDGRDSARVLELAAVNAGFEQRLRNPMDNAVLAAAQDAVAGAWRAIADVPFDFERRCASVLAEHGGRRLLVMKGAPEEILARAVAVEQADGTTRPLDAAMRDTLMQFTDAQAAEGFRCLAIGWRDYAAAEPPRAVDERDLTVAGFLSFVDPPKPTAVTAIHRLETAGVRVKIISGDAPATVQHLVKVLGLRARGLMTGEEVARLGAAALAARASRTDLFARVSPDQKTRIIRALQATGHTVGFIGDGINDAPALHAADVGLAVDSATEVARAAADIIMLEPDLSVLADGVDEGRRTYANIIKYIRMGTSSNFGNMLSMAVASVVIPFLPLTPIQVLFNNLLYDLSEVGIPYDSVDARNVRRPHGWDMSELLHFTLIMGPLSSLFDMATFYILLHIFSAPAEVFRTAWFVESMSTQVLVIFIIRTTVRPWASRPHPMLTVTSLGALGVALLVALTPPGNVFGFVALSGPVLGAIACLVAGYLVAAELLKRAAIAHTRRRRRH